MLKYIVIIYLSLHCAEPTPRDYDWEMLIFTQSWPMSVCQSWTEHNPSHTCNMPKIKNSWTIHGIWPTKTGSMGPSFCNKTWLFNPEEIKPIEESLIDSWTNVEAETSTYGLWSHEWFKHGTCAAQVEAIRGELKYFAQGIKWLLNYEMTVFLNAASITPSDDKNYNLQDIHNAVESMLGVQPCVECRHDAGKQYLQEIRICFDKNLKITDCVCGSADQLYFGKLRGLSNCKPSQGIIYPLTGKPVSKTLVQLYKFVSWLQWFTL